MIRHQGFSIDPAAGQVFGERGRPYVKRVKGYVMASKTVGGLRKYWAAHRLVWEAVNGPIPPDLQINHINGNKSDNRIANLELVTGSENTAHAYRLGLRRAAGEENGRAKLTWSDVGVIRSAKEPVQSLASRFGVSTRTIRDILSWRRRRLA